MKRRATTLLFIIAAIVAIILLISRGCNDGASSQDEQLLLPTSINELIDNSMSSFDYTITLDRDIESFLRKWELKGATFALMRNDSLLYAKGYGYASDTTKCTPGNIFRIASASKLLTATAIMKLREQDKLSLSSTVFGENGILNDSMFLDLRSRNAENITIDHLLRHTAGFSSPHGDPAFANYSIARQINRELPLTLDDMVLYATQNRLRCRPGDCFRYSNLGYMILSRVVEEITGVDYESYVRDSILIPIGCYDMHIGENFREDRADNEVDYYEVKEAKPVEAYDGSGMMTMKSNGGNNVTLLSGAGGWVSSAPEFLRFIASINGDPSKEDILSRESVAMMTQSGNGKRPIGWATTNNNEWRRSGSMAGTSALVKKQKDGYTWIFITNSSSWNGSRLSNYISTHITRALAKVKEWPEHDLFDIE